MSVEGPKVAELRSSVGSTKRLLWRKQTLGIEFSGAANDPKRTINVSYVSSVVAALLTLPDIG
jgi:hypothetical protein